MLYYINCTKNDDKSLPFEQIQILLVMIYCEPGIMYYIYIIFSIPSLF